MPAIASDDCAGGDAASAACTLQVDRDSARRALSAKTCARLFPNQEVMQTACASSCRSFTSGDGQDCAFTFSRSLHEVALDRPDPHAFFWPVALIAVVIGTACWGLWSARHKFRRIP
jgi:hypothetical protein